MDGVLEATITLFGCKVLFNFLCLPLFKGSISSISLCCSCLLFFTDLSVTFFLVYLRWPGLGMASFRPSSDIIALRFLLFLSNTYGAVLMLTPLLVTVEVLVNLLGPKEILMRLNAKGKIIVQTKESQGGAIDTGIGSLQKKDEKNGSDLPLLVAVEVLDDQLGLEETLTRLKMNDKTVEKNKESQISATKIGEIRSLQKGKKMGKGGSDLKTVGFLACLLLWIICGSCAKSSWRNEQATVRECLERGSSLSTCLPHLIRGSLPFRHEFLWVLPAAFLLLGLTILLGELVPKWAQTYPILGKSRAAELWAQSESSDTLKPVQQLPERRLNPLAVVSQDRGVDSGKTATSCTIHKAEIGINKQQRLRENLALLCHQTGLDSVFKKDDTVLILQGHVGLFKNRANEIRRIRRPQWETPCLRLDLITGFVCVLLVCVLPTVFSTSLLLISSLDKLVMYAVKHLLNPSHAK